MEMQSLPLGEQLSVMIEAYAVSRASGNLFLIELASAELKQLLSTVRILPASDQEDSTDPQG